MKSAKNELTPLVRDADVDDILSTKEPSDEHDKSESASGSDHSVPFEMWLACILRFLDGFGYFVINYVFVLFLSDEFGYSDYHAGLMYALQSTVNCLLGFLTGRLIDAVGIKWSLALGFVVQSLSRLMLAFCYSNISIVISIIFLYGLGTAIVQPALQVAVKKYSSSPFGLTFGFNAMLVALKLSGFMAVLSVDLAFFFIPLDSHSSLSANRVLFLVGGIFSVASVFLALLFPQNLSLVTPAVSSQTSPKSRGAPLYCQGSGYFWRLVLLTVLTTGANVQMKNQTTLLPKFMRRSIGPDAKFGLVSSLNPLLVITFLLPLTPFLAGFQGRGSLSVINWGCLITCLSPLPLMFSGEGSYLNCIVFTVVMTLGEMLWSARLYQYITDTAAPPSRGFYLSSLFSLKQAAGRAFSGILSGWLLHSFYPKDNPLPQNAQLLWTYSFVFCMLPSLLLFVVGDWIAAGTLPVLKRTEIQEP